ncbi:MAG: hypothetical protein ACI4LX_02270 [Treponema sp.]
MNVTILEKKISTLTLQQQKTIDSYIDFLIFQNENQTKNRRSHLDFSKYNTQTHLWSEDAQDFVNRMRSDDRF